MAAISPDALSDCCAYWPVGSDAPCGWVGAAARLQSLAPYVPTPEDVVERMLAPGRDDQRRTWSSTSAEVTAASRLPPQRLFGARGVGIDIDPRRIEESRANAKAAGVEHLVEFRLRDALKADVSAATVVTLYMLARATPRCVRC